MKRILIGLLAVGALYAVACVVVGLLLHRSNVARREQEAQLVAMANKLAPAIEEMPLFGDSLKQACAGKLQAGGERSIALYSLPIEQGLRPSLDGKRVDGVLASWVGTYVGIDPADPFGPAPELSRSLSRALEFYEWPHHLEERTAFDQETSSLRYLVVAKFSDLSAPSLPFSDTGTFDPGSAKYHAKVVSFPEGAVICEGTGEARMVEKVIGHGQGEDRFDAHANARSELELKLRDKWIDATVGSVLEDVCEAGGKHLCFSAGLMTSGPDW